MWPGGLGGLTLGLCEPSDPRPLPLVREGCKALPGQGLSVPQEMLPLRESEADCMNSYVALLFIDERAQPFFYFFFCELHFTLVVVPFVSNPSGI